MKKKKLINAREHSCYHRQHLFAVDSLLQIVVAGCDSSLCCCIFPVLPVPVHYWLWECHISTCLVAMSTFALLFVPSKDVHSHVKTNSAGSCPESIHREITCNRSENRRSCLTLNYTVTPLLSIYWKVVKPWNNVWSTDMKEKNRGCISGKKLACHWWRQR